MNFSLLNIIKNKILKHYTYNNGKIYNLGINNNRDEYEKKFIEINKKKLKKFENKNLKLKQIKREKIQNIILKKNEIQNIIDDFIQLYNENNKYRINCLKKILNVKLKLNKKNNIYFISFYSEFENFIHSRYFNIFFICITNNFNIKDKILFIDILGSLGQSDIFNDDFNKAQYVNIFKDKPLKYILNQNKINNLLENREDPIKNRKIFIKEYKTIESKNIKEKIKAKIKIGNKCLNNENGKVFLKKCKESQYYNYNKNHIKDKDNYCLTYHNDKNLSFTPCKIKENCSKQNKINNCKSIKLRKYGSLEFKNMNKCLNSDFKLKNCHKTDKVNLLK
jgi:hypothetical protein